MSFTIDGLRWDVPCKVERVSEVTASEISGMLLDKSYFNDVLGTWLRYTVSLAVPIGMETRYASLYEQLTQPVDGHLFVLPYNGGTVSVTGRVEVVSDEYVRVPKGHWRSTVFTVIGNHPMKTQTLGEAVTRGLEPLPAFGGVQVGQMYTYTNGGWVLTEYDDADLKAY